MKNVSVIESSLDSRLDIYARYSEPELLNFPKPGEGIFIAESPLVVERALKAGYEPVSMLVEDRQLDSALKLVAGYDNLPVFTGNMDVLSEVTGFKLVRGLLVAMRRKPLASMEELCKNAKRIAVLECVENPTNVGAIMRNAAALNLDAVLLTPGCADPFYRRSLRVSMGCVLQVPWTYIGSQMADWPEAGMTRLKQLGFKTMAMALKENTLDIRDSRLKKEEKLAIILGSEGPGLMDSTIDACDYTVKIPMRPEVDSLNVAAASAVAFWELTNLI